MKGSVIALAAFEHLCEDEVCGAVQNAAHLGNDICPQALAQRMQDGDAAADRGLKEEANAVRLGKRKKLCAVLGNELLVGGDDMLTGLQRAADKVQRCAAAADGLNDQKYFGVRLDNGKVLDHFIVERGIRHIAQIDNVGKRNSLARIFFDCLCVTQQNFCAAAADGAGTKNCNLFHIQSPYASFALR